MFQSLFGSLLNHFYRNGKENVSVRHLSLLFTRSKIVQFIEDLAIFTALNHLGSFGKNFVKFKKNICYLPTKGWSVWRKTVTSVLKCCPWPMASGSIFKTSVTVFQHMDLPAGK